MKQLFFTLRESRDEQKHIGTVIASSDTMLTEKVQTAINEHFDTAITIDTPLKMDDYMYGRVADIKVFIPDSGDGGGGYDVDIEITQTWLY